MNTLSAAVTAAKQSLQINSVAPPEQTPIFSPFVSVDPLRVEVWRGGWCERGTVKETHPATGYVRVEFDKAWMHEWLPFDQVIVLPADPTPARLPLATPVTLASGVQAVITGHSTASRNSYRVSWFDRRYLAVRHKLTDRVNFSVETKTPATEVESV